ncbi:superoxide dismutase [Rhodotorula paludigena]|uniref:superoxide dismutase n=1 Tax=Rhodotorula paludigena TaxID=86838 RepID=UPI00316EA7A5
MPVPSPIPPSSRLSSPSPNSPRTPPPPPTSSFTFSVDDGGRARLQFASLEEVKRSAARNAPTRGGAQLSDGHASSAGPPAPLPSTPTPLPSRHDPSTREASVGDPSSGLGPALSPSAPVASPPSSADDPPSSLPDRLSRILQHPERLPTGLLALFEACVEEGERGGPETTSVLATKVGLVGGKSTELERVVMPPPPVPTRLHKRSRCNVLPPLPSRPHPAYPPKFARPLQFVYETGEEGYEDQRINRNAIVSNSAARSSISPLTSFNSIPAVLPPLPYAYDALEPIISEDIMRIHHDKHHAAYVANFNVAAHNATVALEQGNVLEVVRLTSALSFNGGGHILHSLFWRNLAPANAFSVSPTAGGVFPSSGRLADQVQRNYGNLERLVSTMQQVGGAVQGSGWVWLVWNRQNLLQLEVISTHNQNLPPASQVPLVGVDVWEHAYHRQYAQNRTAYLDAIPAVFNWEEGERRLLAVLNGDDWW